MDDFFTTDGIALARETLERLQDGATLDEESHDTIPDDGARFFRVGDVVVASTFGGFGARRYDSDKAAHKALAGLA